MKWLKSIFTSRRINAVRYFEEKNLDIEIPSLSIKTKKLNGQLGGGKISNRKKNLVAEKATSEHISFDQNQEVATRTIDSIEDPLKRDKLKEQLATATIINISKGNIDNPFDSESKKKIVDGIKLKRYLDDRNFKSTYLPDDLTLNAGYIIWPVALQPGVTYIHNAQVQIIKLFVLAGWKLLVLIGDCGKHNKSNNPIEFIDSLKPILRKNGIALEENTIALLSSYYKREDSSLNSSLVNGVTSTNLLNSFHSISEGMKWNMFSKLIKKNYDDKKQLEIQERSVLNNLHSLLTWSLVATIVKENLERKPKAVIIAGEDEQEQWDYIAKNFSNNKMGVIYIHELKNAEGKTMNQEEINIRSQKEMIDKLDSGNMAEWLFTHFVELPKFLDIKKPSFCKISQVECEKYKNNCLKCLFTEGENFNNTLEFDRNEFTNSIYPLSNPAN
jgi:hypothetical protein